MDGPGFRSNKGVVVFDKGFLPPLPVTSHRDAVEAGRSKRRKKKGKSNYCSVGEHRC